MKRMAHIGFSILTVMVILGACTSEGGMFGERGSGNVVSETRSVSGFTGVVLQGSGDVTVTVGDSESLTIEAEDNLMPHLTSEIENGRLVLGMTGDISPTKDIIYTVTVISLDEVSIEGSGSLTAPDLQGSVLDASISGSGSMVLHDLDIGHFGAAINGSGAIETSGTSDRIELSISGSGSYSGAELVSSTGNVSVPGSGRALVNVTDKLNASISGSGSIRYVGDPMVDSNITGSGTVAPAD